MCEDRVAVRWYLRWNERLPNKPISGQLPVTTPLRLLPLHTHVLQGCQCPSSPLLEAELDVFLHELKTTVDDGSW